MVQLEMGQTFESPVLNLSRAMRRACIESSIRRGRWEKGGTGEESEEQEERVGKGGSEGGHGGE